MGMINEMEDLQKLQHEVGSWADHTFGVQSRTPINILIKMKEELDECIDAVLIEKAFWEAAEFTCLDGGDRNGGDRQLTDKSREEYLKLRKDKFREYADLLLLLIDAAAREGLTIAALTRQGREKLNYVKENYKFEKDGNGEVQRIK